MFSLLGTLIAAVDCTGSFAQNFFQIAQGPKKQWLLVGFDYILRFSEFYSILAKKQWTKQNKFYFRDFFRFSEHPKHPQGCNDRGVK